MPAIPPPVHCASATFAPSTCRWSALPCSCHTSSTSCATPVAPKSDDDYVSELKLGALKSQADILSLATTLERGAASGYISQISSIRDSGLSQLFAQISADEMIHWTTLNGLIGGSLPAEPFQFG